MDLGLAGKVALVTGGTRGIGRATAERLAAEGCLVSLCARDGDEARAVADALGGHGAGVDVLDPEALAAWVDRTATVLGAPELLVANVGGSFGGALLDSTPEAWERTWALNAGHAVAALRACVPHMHEGGSAVFVSSISAAKPQPRAQYGSAKAALEYAAASLAQELGERRVRVNAVAPGSIVFDGGGWGTLLREDPERYAAFAREEFPSGRLGTPEEVARVVAFVLSDAACWINGTTVAVDGGQRAPSAGGY